MLNVQYLLLNDQHLVFCIQWSVVDVQLSRNKAQGVSTAIYNTTVQKVQHYMVCVAKIDHFSESLVLSGLTHFCVFFAGGQQDGMVATNQGTCFGWHVTSRLVYHHSAYISRCVRDTRSAQYWRTTRFFVTIHYRITPFFWILHCLIVLSWPHSFHRTQWYGGDVSRTATVQTVWAMLQWYHPQPAVGKYFPLVETLLCCHFRGGTTAAATLTW